ncbi:MAG: ATP-binding protein [Acidobacteriaceae bacterium]|jgi:ATP-dependent DNA helicase RecG
MSIEVIEISSEERDKALLTHEGHFSDVKAIEIAPAKLTKTIAAFSNADGGEVFVGIAEDKTKNTRHWSGFGSPEAANGHIQIFEKLFPLGEGYSYTFMKCSTDIGFVLKVDIQKSRTIKVASDGIVYVRRGAQNIPFTTTDELARLERNKGLTSFETELLNADPKVITNSMVSIEFMLEIVPTAEPDEWLHKQNLIVQNKPTVAGAVLFAEEPQALLPKRTGIKIYRYKTKAEEGTRETLDGNPQSIEGHAYKQIYDSVRVTSSIIESVRVNTPDGLETVKYPITALHEIITNAVLHRDYSLADDIHIRIFDNRVEVISPGTLPAHITPQNILDERFSRNGVIVRLINKFPNPPNKDVGEGLNSAFLAMREMKLKPPTIEQGPNSVKVVLKHESLATPEELILAYLRSNASIKNSVARDICFIGSENKMKGILQRLVTKGLIELVPGTTRYSAAYRLVQKTTKTSAQRSR